MSPLYISKIRESPGGLVVRVLGFHCRGPGSIPGLGSEMLQAPWHGQTKKQNPQKTKDP